MTHIRQKPLFHIILTIFSHLVFALRTFTFLTFAIAIRQHFFFEIPFFFCIFISIVVVPRIVSIDDTTFATKSKICCIFYCALIWCLRTLLMFHRLFDRFQTICFALTFALLSSFRCIQN